MAKKPDHFRLVQIPTTYVVSNVDTDMTLRHSPIHFGTSPVHILQRDLAEWPKSIRVTCAHLDRPIIHQAGPRRGYGRICVITKQQWRRRHNLDIDPVLIHTSHPCIGIPE